MEDYILLQIHDYDYHENFKNLEDLKKKYPTPITFTLITLEAIDKYYSIEKSVEEGLVKENEFDDNYLKEYARVKASEQNPPAIWNFGVFQKEINGKLCTCTGSYPERPATEEEIITAYKKANEYSWV